jgi:hypothetical protein
VASLVRTDNTYDGDDLHLIDSFMIQRFGCEQYWLVGGRKKTAGHWPAAK